MKLLLDTNVLLWFLFSPEKLAQYAADAVLDQQNELLVSIASTWEIAVEIKIGKLAIPGDGLRSLFVTLDKQGLRLLAVEPSHLYVLEDLELLHRDPFDRLIVAQAIAESAILVTSDSLLRRYPVRTL